MKRSALAVWSLLAVVAACGGRSTGLLEEDDAPDGDGASAQGNGGTGGTGGTGGSGGGPSIAGSGGSQNIAGSGGGLAIPGSGGGGGTAGSTSGAPDGAKPTGEDQPCQSDADCARFDASFCDVFVTGTCLVRGCTVAPDNCYQGKECCDLSDFGLPTLCIAEGVCN
jgi:hypothetical protein